MKQYSYPTIFLLIFLIITSLSPIDNLHYYKAPRFHGFYTTSQWDQERRYETLHWKTSLDITFATGSACQSWNICGEKVPLLSLSGCGNMPALIANTQALPSSNNFVHVLAKDLMQGIGAGSFGQLLFGGKFTIDEGYIELRQNFMAGFFLRANLPIRNVTVKNVCYTDCSPETGIFSQTTPSWRRFKNNFDAVLANYNILPMCVKFSNTDVGDLSILAGWEQYDTTSVEWLSYLAACWQVGVLLPTSETENQNYFFPIPTGYNGHWAVPIHAYVLIGATDWLRLAVRAGALFFFNHTRMMRVKTLNAQCGPLKVARGRMNEDLGTHWYVGADVKFDHICKGFSFLFGYSFNRAEKTTLCPQARCCIISCSSCADSSACSACPPIVPSTTTDCCSPCNKIPMQVDAYNACVVNSDSALCPWQMHVLHLIVDYDFGIHMKAYHWAPRLQFFYDVPVAGEHVFDTDMIGGGVGLDIRW